MTSGKTNLEKALEEYIESCKEVQSACKLFIWICAIAAIFGILFFIFIIITIL